MLDLSLLHGDCLNILPTLADGSVDLTVTSPPYDNLRTYKGYTFDFEPIARELYRVTKPGGVVVWVVGDATVKGSETGTSFKQALYFKECGFNLHDTMIYEVAGTGAKGSNLAYWQGFEFMFIFSKGTPSTINRLRDKPNTKAGTLINKTIGGRSPKYGKKADGQYRISDFGFRTNIWRYHAGRNGDDQTEHPAPFPEALARDHILSWSNEGDTVLDCFMGSGTTGKMAVLNNRNFIGIEVAREYFEIAERRIDEAQMQTVMEFA